MFRTIKSKITVISILMLTFSVFAFGFHTIFSRMKTKQLMVQNYRASINTYFEEISDSISRLEDNLKSLSLIGSLFYKTDRSYQLTNKAITKIFESYPETLGGGIWFIPYKLDKNKKYVCFYAYRDKNNKIIIDKNFASNKYDYPNKSWYKEIISQITPEYNVVWTKPYFENQGSYTMMITVGTGIYVDGELVGLATVDWEISSVIEKISKMKPLDKSFSMYKGGKKIKNSFALFGNKIQDYIIATTDPYLDKEKLVGHSLTKAPWYAENLFGITYITYHGKKYIPFVFENKNNGLVLIICVPKSEMFRSVDEFYSIMIIIMLLFVFITLAIVYYGINKYLINPIDKLMSIANKIGKGEDVQIKIEKPEEFAQLASTFDKMKEDIKNITKERQRIDSELSVARTIQSSSLPNVFPPFPDSDEFDIFASMKPAKEVGGDFYDFYFIDDDNFMFLIADVSGKGIPAALFMMTVKTLINNISQLGYSPKEMIEEINRKICKSNSQGLFITMFVGIVNAKTGKITYINCGHNKPLIKTENNDFKYLNIDSNIVLGAFDNAKYNVYEAQLNRGDIIFTYTDGITEALNKYGEFFGEDRLLESVNYLKEENINAIARKISSDILKFTDLVSQSDDLTMLIFKYNGPSQIETFKGLALQENYKNFYTWLHEICKKWNLDNNLANKLDMCCEEIYANITFYAYPEKQGDIEVNIEKKNKKIILQFKDNGIKYNPLEKPDPDLNLPPQERPLGGLGIFMVKEISDNIEYEYLAETNILTLKFNI
ncbi:SpoIIE family protein phosphatase [bacterium]|nr:SpoIIE family protein phosphatase [bacterium]